MKKTDYSQAACKQIPNVVFFHEHPNKENYFTARKICNSCPIIDDCLDDNLYEKTGFWGGTTEDERRDIRRERKS